MNTKPVLYWPKLVEGQMYVTPTKGFGDGYSYGTGNGSGRGCGLGFGYDNGAGYGGGISIGDYDNGMRK